MPQNKYIARKRARFKALCGPVNIPFGTTLINQGGFLIWRDQRICTDTSQNAYDFFCHNDDGRGKDRAGLLNTIISKLEKHDAEFQARWNKVWGDPLCQQYKRPEHEEHWIWNHAFYNAPVEDLRHIAALIGA